MHATWPTLIPSMSHMFCSSRLTGTVRFEYDYLPLHVLFKYILGLYHLLIRCNVCYVEECLLAVMSFG